MVLSPIKWFTDGKIELLSEHDGKVDNNLLTDFNWYCNFLCDRDYRELSNNPGVYIFVDDDYPDRFLYVGQSENIGNRAFNPQTHHKLSWIIDLLDNWPFRYSNYEPAYERIVVYHKEVSEKDFNNSLKRSLIWCESITIGLLKPLFQDDISDVFNPYNNTGTLRQFDEDIDDDDMDEDSF
jgi:hypothetical protein